MCGQCLFSPTVMCNDIGPQILQTLKKHSQTSRVLVYICFSTFGRGGEEKKINVCTRILVGTHQWEITGPWPYQLLQMGAAHHICSKKKSFCVSKTSCHFGARGFQFSMTHWYLLHLKLTLDLCELHTDATPDPWAFARIKWSWTGVGGDVAAWNEPLQLDGIAGIFCISTVWFNQKGLCCFRLKNKNKNTLIQPIQHFREGYVRACKGVLHTASHFFTIVRTMTKRLINSL